LDTYVKTIRTTVEGSAPVETFDEFFHAWFPSLARAMALIVRDMDDGSEIAQEIKEVLAKISYYGLSQTAAERSVNFVFFPFSFSKKLITSMGDFMLQAPARALLLHEGLRRYHESEADEKVKDFLDRHAPLLQQLAKINNLSYGLSPGRFFLEGLDDNRTNVGKAMQMLTSVFVPSGAATPLAQAAGGLGDLAIHAFVPVVITGESIDRAGGIDGLDDIVSRYIPFVREFQQYFEAGGDQATALTEGGSRYWQFQHYLDDLRDAKGEYEPLAAVMGYSSVDGLLQSDTGQLLAAQLDVQREELQAKYPTGWKMTTEFTNTDAINSKALLDLAKKEDRSEAEELILNLTEDVERYRMMGELLDLDPSLMGMIAAKSLRDEAKKHVADRRFRELYARFFEPEYGPISVAA
jgi:hypothetical protein